MSISNHQNITPQNHVWNCVNVHAEEGYPPFAPCGCPSVDDVVIKPLEDSAWVTLSRIEVALGMLLASKNDLDAGQHETCLEALRRIEQVTSELGDE